MGEALRGDINMIVKITSWVMVAVMAVAIGYLIYWDARTPQLNLLGAFAAALWLNALITCAMGLRSYLLSHRRIPYLTALKANGVTLTGLWIIPARMSEFIKPFYFKHYADYPKQKGFALTVKERVWDLFGFAIIIGLAAGFLVLERELGADIQSNIMSQLSMTVGVFCMAVIGLLILPTLTRKISLLHRFQDFADSLRGDGVAYNVTQALLALFLWAGSALLLVIFYSHSGLPELTIAQMTMVFVISTLGLLMTLTPAGIGTHEAAVVGILSHYGVAVGDALAFAIAFRFCWMASPTIIGLYALVKDGSIFLKEVRDAQG